MAIINCWRDDTHQYSDHLGACPFCERAGVTTKGRSPAQASATIQTTTTTGPRAKPKSPRFPRILVGLVTVVAIYAWFNSGFVVPHAVEDLWGSSAAETRNPWSEVSDGDCFSNYSADIPLIGRNEVALKIIDCASPQSRLMVIGISAQATGCNEADFSCYKVRINDTDYVYIGASPNVGDCLHGAENMRYPGIGEVLYGLHGLVGFDCSKETTPVTSQLAEKFGQSISNNSLVPRKFRLESVVPNQDQCPHDSIRWRITLRPETGTQPAIHTNFCTTSV